MFCSAIRRLKRSLICADCLGNVDRTAAPYFAEVIETKQSLLPNNLWILIWCGVAGTGLTPSPMLELGKTFMEFYCGYQWMSFSAASLSTGIYLAGLALPDSHYPNLISIYRNLGVLWAPTICLSSRKSRLLAVRTVRTFHVNHDTGRWAVTDVKYNNSQVTD